MIDDSILSLIKNELVLDGYNKIDDNDAAYIVYTFGTIRSPKGVLYECGSYKRIYESDMTDEKQKTNIKTRFAFASAFDNILAI